MEQSLFDTRVLVCRLTPTLRLSRIGRFVFVLSVLKRKTRWSIVLAGCTLSLFCSLSRLSLPGPFSALSLSLCHLLYPQYGKSRSPVDSLRPLSGGSTASAPFRTCYYCSDTHTHALYSEATKQRHKEEREKRRLRKKEHDRNDTRDRSSRANPT